MQNQLRPSGPIEKTFRMRARLLAGLALVGLALPSWSLNDKLALTPPMGWNSWNHFRGTITEAKFKAIADAFVSSGLKDAGYQYLVIDDGWLEAKRDAGGNVIVVAAQFPNGMKALADYAHAKGLKMGLYACPTKTTCMRRMGSYNHETQDAQAFASWGVDFLKYDWCGVQSGEDAAGVTVAEVKRRYVVMREAIKATGRPIIYALCEKGQGTKGVEPGTWQDTVGHMWRIGGDINASWSSVVAHADENAPLAQYSGPGGWNDPDMLEVGNGPLTVAENRSHFSLWCIQAAPLMLGNDPSTMSADIKAILTNKEAIAVDQDSLGIQGQRIKGKGALEVWVKELKGGEKAVLLANRTAATATISVQWTDSLIKWSANEKVDIRDLWKHKDSLEVTKGLAASVASHDVAMFRLKKSSSTALAGADPGTRRLRYGPAGGPGLYLSAEEAAGNAQVSDWFGRKLFSFRPVAGWNAFPGRRLGPGIYFVTVGAPGSTRTLRLLQF